MSEPEVFYQGEFRLGEFEAENGWQRESMTLTFHGEIESARTLTLQVPFIIPEFHFDDTYIVTITKKEE